MSETTRREEIERRLLARFSPSILNVTDESDQHTGHGGARAEGQTHYRVRLASETFDGLNLVAAHRLIYAELDDHFQQGLHALAIEVVREPKEKLS
jgi:BolA family transcriptional regulator, general stress-responsive regulator